MNAVIVIAAITAQLVFYELTPWPTAPIKNFVYWLIGTAFFSTYRVASNQQSGLREFATDTLRVSVVFEFLVNISTFSLPVELILMPILHFVVLANALIDVKAELKHAKPLFSALQTFFGLALIAWLLIYAVSTWPSILAPENIRDLVYPVAMSILFSPFLVLLHAYFAYEKLQVQIEMRTGDREAAGRLLVKAMRAFGLNVELAARWGRMCLGEGAKQERDWIKNINEVKRRVRKESDKKAAPRNGHSLHQAMHLLDAHNLSVKEYNRLFGGRWSGSARTKLYENDLGSSLSYRICGTANAVRQFEISLDVMWPEHSDGAEIDYFAVVAGHVTRAVLGDNELRELKFEFAEKGRETRIIGDKRLVVEFEPNAFVQEGSFSLTLLIAYRDFDLFQTLDTDVGDPSSLQTA